MEYPFSSSGHMYIYIHYNKTYSRSLNCISACKVVVSSDPLVPIIIFVIKYAVFPRDFSKCSQNIFTIWGIYSNSKAYLDITVH